MESGCDDFTVVTPVIAFADEKTVSEPWLEETIFFSFLQMNLTVQDDFNVIWVWNGDEEFASEPESNNFSVFLLFTNG